MTKLTQVTASTTHIRQSQRLSSKGFGKTAASMMVMSALGLAAMAPVAANAAVTGAQKTLVFLVNFQENPNDLPMSVSEADAMVFGTVNDFYRAASDNQLWLTGTVAGVFTAPMSNQVCNNANTLAQSINEQAIAAGVPLNQYDRYVYLTTKDACQSEGSATLTGLPSRAVINGPQPARVVAHEFGHNLGLEHAGAWDCDAGTLAGNCRVIEYGDSYSTMGNSDMGYFGAEQKEQLGWVSAASGAVAVAAEDGVYTLGAYEQSNGQPIAVKIPRGADPVTGKQRWFYIEYRQSLAHDSFLAARSYTMYRGDVTEGVLVRMVTEGEPRSRVLHMKPDAYFKQRYGMNDWKDPAMAIGDSFTDPDSGVTFSLLSANGNTADISVQLGSAAGQCLKASPTVSAVQSVASGNAGDTVQYSVRIENRDSADCAASDYRVAANVLSGWQANTATVTLAPGASQQVTLAVTSAGNSADGNYNVPVTATSLADSSVKGSTNLTYQVIAAPAASELVANNDQVNISSKQAVTIEVKANDVIAQGANVTVQVSAAAKGSVEVLSDGSVRYTPAKAFKTSDSFSYTLFDGISSSSATVTVTLSSSTTDTGDTSTGGSTGGKGKNR
ncbi:Ig-like domain-containing protein [Shewanella zhangzhouensis]|uniref:Ig-like domain-containing protein n=1 Tax=Shewanella zhangzhouensis TaxID=2864213 RepID=UPI001C65FD87|nr:Ig-like domain-containing protein [Shewanella zhangzhouensis]QYK06666.1 cadherin-like domain-containing protein [Shewanella zhangzhouensis]